MKDKSAPRGFLQKAVVLLTRWPFYDLFRRIIRIVGPLYFLHGVSALELAFDSSSAWDPVRPRKFFSLPLLGHVLEVRTSNSKDHLEYRDLAIECRGHDLYSPMYGSASLLYDLWEIMLCGDPLLVFGKSPEHVSLMICNLVRLFSQSSTLAYVGDFRPYITLQCKYAQRIVDGDVSSDDCPLILGVTNPFFLKALGKRWENVLILGQDDVLRGESLKANVLRIAEDASVSDYVPKLGRSNRRRSFLMRRRESLVLLRREMLRELRTPTRLSVSDASVTIVDASAVENTTLLLHEFSRLSDEFLAPFERRIRDAVRKSDISALFIDVMCGNDDDKRREVDTVSDLGIASHRAKLYRNFIRGPNFRAWVSPRLCLARRRILVGTCPASVSWSKVKRSEALDRIEAMIAEEHAKPKSSRDLALLRALTSHRGGLASEDPVS
eukprot:g3625.t1